MDFSPHFTVGVVLCSVAVSVPQWIGLYLFQKGVADFRKGVMEAMTHNRMLDQGEYLMYVCPVCCLARVLCAPAMWYWAAEQDDAAHMFHSMFALLWTLCFVVPFAWFGRLVTGPGIVDVLDSYKTLRDWPQDCEVNRPYQGLLSTRCWALFGAFWIELLWSAWIVYSGGDVSRRFFGITFAFVLFNAGMVAGGPINFLARGPNCDRWIAWTYIALSLVAVVGYSVLASLPFGLGAAVAGAEFPMKHWSYWGILACLLTQWLTCEWVVGQGTELKAGPPWAAGGCDHKEFFFPRFLGLIFECRGMFLSFQLWVVGVWMWGQAQPETTLLS